MRKTLNQLSAFGQEVFRQAGLNQANATIATDALVAADSWGIHTHGLKNLGGYVNRLNAGGLNPLGQARDCGGTCLGECGWYASLEMIGSTFAMRQAIRKAAVSGIGFAGLCNKLPLWSGQLLRLARSGRGHDRYCHVKRHADRHRPGCTRTGAGQQPDRLRGSCRRTVGAS